MTTDRDQATGTAALMATLLGMSPIRAGVHVNPAPHLPWLLRTKLGQLDRAAKAGRLSPCTHGTGVFASLWSPDRTSCGSCLDEILPELASMSGWHCHWCRSDVAIEPELDNVGFGVISTHRLVVVYGLCPACANTDPIRNRRRPRRRPETTVPKENR